MSIKKGVGILSLCTFLLLGLNLFAKTEVKRGEHVVVTNTASGKVRGYIHNGIYINKSIPYSLKTSLGSRRKLEDFINLTDNNNTVTANNTIDMALVNGTKKKMGDKPVVVIVHVSKPMVFSEIEKNASVTLVHMRVQDQALMGMISGKSEPSALLPFQMPADMKTVEIQFDDVARDMNVYVDSEGKSYDFAFGLNCNSVIADNKVAVYIGSGY